MRETYDDGAIRKTTLRDYNRSDKGGGKTWVTNHNGRQHRVVERVPSIQILAKYAVVVGEGQKQEAGRTYAGLISAAQVTVILYCFGPR